MNDDHYKNIDFYMAAKERTDHFSEFLNTTLEKSHSGILHDSMHSYFSKQDEKTLLFYDQKIVQDILSTLDDLESAVLTFKEATESTQHQSIIIEMLAYTLSHSFSRSEVKESPYIEFFSFTGLLNTIQHWLDYNTLTAIVNIIDTLVNSCTEQKHALYERRRQLVKKDIYGFIDLSQWEAEKIVFSRKLLVSAGIERDVIESIFGFCFIKVLTNNIIDSSINRSDIETCHDTINEYNSMISNHRKGVDYEDECIESFRESGWAALETSKTGDRGADIIASKRGFKIVVQCKNWSGKIDTSAIQEISTAQLYYEADFAVLICETTPTKQAQEMAEKLGTLIINKEDIPEIEIVLIKQLLQSNCTR